MPATTAFKGTPVRLSGDLPVLGKPAPAFAVVGPDLAEITRAAFPGHRVLLNIFPSIDTKVCALSVRRFNAEVAQLPATTVLCVSMDLPFALSRFCGAEGLTGVKVGSAFRGTFGRDYGLTIQDSVLAGLLARAVILLDADGIVRHVELVPEISREPDYAAALAAAR